MSVSFLSSVDVFNFRKECPACSVHDVAGSSGVQTDDELRHPNDVALTGFSDSILRCKGPSKYEWAVCGLECVFLCSSRGLIFNLFMNANHDDSMKPTNFC